MSLAPPSRLPAATPAAAVLAAALLAAGAGCGPRVDPAAPDSGEDGVARSVPGPRPDGPSPGGRDVLVGEMCPAAADSRPAVLPQFVRGITWSSQAADLSAPIERRSARQFMVLGWDGRRVGVFSVVGPAQVDDGVAAIGAYAGSSPCERPRSPGAGPEKDAACVAVQRDCALAVAMLEPAGGFGARPAEEDPDPIDLTTGGACVTGDQLRVDLDGDGAIEAFPVAGFLDEARGPAEEVLAAEPGGGTCEPAFAQRGVVPAADPRDWRGMDLLGVVDLDADGRLELVTVYQYAGRRTWALYTAGDTTGRLDLVGEAVPWSSR